MQRFKALLPVRRSLHRHRFLSLHQHGFSAQPNYAYYDDTREQVLVEGRANSRAAILNSPSSLNALTTYMAARLKRLYESWEENPDIGFVMMKGKGRAFCSGADVVTLYNLVNEGKVEECKTFFRTLYNFVYLLGTYLKPHLSCSANEFECELKDIVLARYRRSTKFPCQSGFLNFMLRELH